MIVGRICHDDEGRSIVARDLLAAAAATQGQFMYVELHGRGAPRGDTCTIYPGLRGRLCNVNPNTGRTVVVVAVEKVRAWANRNFEQSRE